MSAAISLADSDVFTSLRTFLLGVLLTGTEVVQGQDNGVPMPKGDFVTLTSKENSRIETNVVSYVDPGINPGSAVVLTSSEYVIQMDFYGANSAQNAKITEALFRDGYALTAFTNSNIKPLYADGPIQIPLVNAEEQYEQRWKLDAHIQYNPAVTVSQDFAAALTVNTISVEATYPI